MTHRALAQEGPDLRREDLDIPSPRRRRHRHKGLARSRSNAVEDSRLGRRYFTGRFCPVHNWPVFRCPPRRKPTNSTKENCSKLRVMFVDIDFKDMPEAEARGLLAAFSLSPSVVLHSGNG